MGVRSILPPDSLKTTICLYLGSHSVWGEMYAFQEEATAVFARVDAVFASSWKAAAPNLKRTPVPLSRSILFQGALSSQRVYD